jgi:hypothetical protein
MSEQEIVRVSKRLDAVRRVRQAFAEMGALLVEELSADDAERVVQAGRTAAANELSRVFDEARADMDGVLNAR